MRNKKTQGFTLIELLIVIAIIGILAAVLIPNLLNARTQAAERAAQAHSSNVYTALVAALSSDTLATADSIVTDSGVDCKIEGGAGAGVGEFTWNAAPNGVTTCVIAANGTSDFTATIVTDNSKKYENGKDVTGVVAQ